MSVSKKHSGKYLYNLNGELAPVDEYWCREGFSDGSVRVSSGRRAGAVAIDVEALEVERCIQSFSAHWREKGGRELAVDYTLRQQSLCVVRREGADVREEVLDRPAGEIQLFPLMRIYAGAVIEGLLAAGGSGCVVLPEIGVASDSVQLFEPRFSQRRAELVTSEVLQDSSGEERPCRRCRYLGDQYDEDASFWIGEDHLLERYQWRQDAARLWDVTLVRDD